MSTEKIERLRQQQIEIDQQWEQGDDPAAAIKVRLCQQIMTLIEKDTMDHAEVENLDDHLDGLCHLAAWTILHAAGGLTANRDMPLFDAASGICERVAELVSLMVRDNLSPVRVRKEDGKVIDAD